MIGLVMLAAAAVATCPGGPVFAFQPGSAKFIGEADGAIPAYLPVLNSVLWREGWITVEPVVRDATDRSSLQLVHQRERAIQRRMRGLGIAGSRIRFGKPRLASRGDDLTSIDAYWSTLSVPQAIYDRVVSPGVLC